VLAKIENVTRIARENYESFQILQYDVGQSYNTHHDMSPLVLHSNIFTNFIYMLFRRQNHLACGPRILTFFLYLSDVEEGGETFFPALNYKGIETFKCYF
jgi:prolyl 4-hydroxylase